MGILLFWLLPCFGLDISDAFTDRMDETQSLISEKVVNYSDAIDEFFASERFEQENSKSYIRVTSGILYPYNEAPVLRPQIRANIQLPNTQKRFNLVFESISDSLSEGGGDQATNSVSSLDEDEENEYSFSLRYFMINTKEWNAFVESGIKLVVPPEPFAKIRLRRTFHLGHWENRFTTSVFWFQNSGFGHREVLEFDRAINKTLLFRIFNSITWSFDDQITRLSHAYILFHTLSERDVLSYAAAVNGVNKPILLNTNYVFAINYRRRLYKTWLYFEAEPAMTWPRTENFRPTPSILFKLEATFGAIR